MLYAEHKGYIIEPDGIKKINLAALRSIGFDKVEGKTAIYEE